MQRSDVIADFLKRAYAQIHPTGVLLSLDVFGVMAWQRPVDLAHTGQDIVAMAKHCDVLSPMIYPSHFFGMDGYDKPGDAPEHFIGESMDRFKLITKDSGVVIRPWLQAFAWRTKTYSPKYVEVQVEVAKQKGGVGFLFWNANNDYSKPYAAMPEMRARQRRVLPRRRNRREAEGGRCGYCSINGGHFLCFCGRPSQRNTRKPRQREPIAGPSRPAVHPLIG